jgi:hypothetical protein
MATQSNNFLSEFKKSLIIYGDEVAFKPYRAGSWESVTFNDHHRHVTVAASYWKTKMAEIGLKQGDVVGMWFVLLLSLHIQYTK